MAKQSNPFTDFDVSKLMADFRMPGVDMTNMMTTQRKNIEALTEANKTAVECMQTVSRRQVEIMRESMEELSTMMKEMMTEGGPEDKMAKQTELMQEGFERTLKHMRELSDMMAKANAEAVDIVSKRVSESLAELRGQVEAAKTTARSK